MEKIITERILFTSSLLLENKKEQNEFVEFKNINRHLSDGYKIISFSKEILKESNGDPSEIIITAHLCKDF